MREYVECSSMAETVNDFYNDPGAGQFTSIRTQFTPIGSDFKTVFDFYDGLGAGLPPRRCPRAQQIGSGAASCHRAMGRRPLAPVSETAGGGANVCRDPFQVCMCEGVDVVPREYACACAYVIWDCG